MKLKEYIRKLQEFPPDMVVCLADWSEEYAKPNEEVAGVMRVVTETYTNKDKETITGQFLRIGSDWP